MSFLKNLFSGNKATVEVPPPVLLKPEATAEVTEAVAEPVELNESPIQLSDHDILLRQKLATKEAVLQLIAGKMLECGYVSGDYTQALAERESKVSTYLLNGVAIPHGTNEAKDLVSATGIIVVQIPDGVVWNDKGDLVKLAVGIAANGKEHLGILQQLTKVVMDEALVTHLGEQANAAEIAQALGQELQVNEEAEQQVIEDLPVTADAMVVDKAGMHARPASLISEMASRFKHTDIRLRNNNRMANGKSMAELLAMGAVEGDLIIVSAFGKEAKEAVAFIAQAINAGLDADEVIGSDHTQYNPLDALPALETVTGRATFTGAAASPGIAAAPIYVFKETALQLIRDCADVECELTSLENGISKAHEQLESLYGEMKGSAPNEAAIFKAQQQLLSDEAILQAAKSRVRDGCGAAWSWRKVLTDQIKSLEAVNDERIKGRAADMADVSERVVRILENKEEGFTCPEDEEFILLASELTPSQTACLDSVPIRAIVTELGGPNSHMAILARALGIPAIVGLGEGVLEKVSDGEVGIVDPQSSRFVVSPDSNTMDEAQVRIGLWNKLQNLEAEQKFEEAITPDGHKVDVVCNIAKPKDAPLVLNNGGEGVGLLRTEFMFEASKSEPSVDEQMLALQEIVSTLGSRQLVVRTADIGGDKPVSWLDMPAEDNPFLGVRGIRLSFRNENMFRHQLEAIYRVALWQEERHVKSGIHIMFPMIAKLSEWHKAKDIAEDVRKMVGAPTLPLGIMIEVPSAALLAEHFAKEVDFFSVGSNDMTQYTLAMDRLHPELAAEADSYSPALLKLISMTVEAATANGKWVGVCGNMAADPDMACLLIGLGVKELSVSPANIPALKMLIRAVTYEKLKVKAKKALSLGHSSEIRMLYKNRADLL